MSGWSDERSGVNKIWCQTCDEMRPREHVKLDRWLRDDGSLVYAYVCRESNGD